MSVPPAYLVEPQADGSLPAVLASVSWPLGSLQTQGSREAGREAAGWRLGGHVAGPQGGVSGAVSSSRHCR